jgi:hypothetical protein
MDIDMQSFSGVEGLAAADQPNTQIAQVASEDYPVYEEFLEKETPMQQPEVAQDAPVVNEQEFNFKALREEVDRIKAEREAERNEYRQNLEMMRANNASQTQRPQVQEKPMFDGMDDTEVPNVGEIRSAWAQKESAYQSRIEELEVAREHSDYAEVLTKYTAPLIQQKPHLAEGLKGASNKALYAYELGVMARAMQQQQQPAQVVQQPVATPQGQAKAQRIIENSRRPGTLSSASGQTTITKADYYATMSDKDFHAIASKHLGEI